LVAIAIKVSLAMTLQYFDRAGFVPVAERLADRCPHDQKSLAISRRMNLYEPV
jgi:hypothetical protein